MTHTVDVAFKLLVGIDRHVMGEILIRLGHIEDMISSILSITCPTKQTHEDIILHLGTLIHVALKLFLSLEEI